MGLILSRIGRQINHRLERARFHATDYLSRSPRLLYAASVIVDPFGRHSPLPTQLSNLSLEQWSQFLAANNIGHGNSMGTYDCVVIHPSLRRPTIEQMEKARNILCGGIVGNLFWNAVGMKWSRELIGATTKLENQYEDNLEPIRISRFRTNDYWFRFAFYKPLDTATFEKTEDDSVTYKGYVTFSGNIFEDLTPQGFAGFVDKLHAAGYLGDFKICSKIGNYSEALTRFEGIVIHGRNKANRDLAMRVAMEHFGSRRMRYEYSLDEQGETHKAGSQIVSLIINQRLNGRISAEEAFLRIKNLFNAASPSIPT